MFPKHAILMSSNDFKAVSQDTAYNSLTQYLMGAYNQTEVTGGGNGIYRSFRVLDDTEFQYKTNVLFIGMLKNALHWFNTEILPAVITEEKHFSTTIIHFEHATMSMVPAFGTTRLTRTKKTQNISKSKRYGISSVIEGDFKDTVKGRDDILMNLLFFAGMGAEQLSYMGYAALQAGDVNNPQRIPQYLDNNEGMYRNRLIDEADFFAIGNKCVTGVNKVVIRTIQMMQKLHQITPKFALMPQSKVSLLMSTGNKQYYDNQHAGSDGHARLMDKYTITEINGVKVREAPCYVENIDSPHVDAMGRDVFTGQFFLLKPYPGQAFPCQWGIYDVVVDDDVYITSLDVIKHDPRFAIQTDGFYGYSPECIEYFKQFENTTHSLGDPFPDPFLIVGSDKKLTPDPAFTKFNPADVEKTLWHYVFRPMIGTNMEDIMMVDGGLKLGMIAHTEFNIAMGHDVGNESWTIELRGYVCPHIVDWRHVTNVRNVFYNGVISGGNTKLIEIVNAKRYSNMGFDLERNELAPSMYAISFPAKSYCHDDIIIHLLGESPFQGQKNDCHEDYPGSQFYKTCYGWNTLSDMRLSLDESPKIATVMFQGGLRYFTQAGSKIKIPGKGHHGAHEETGCAVVRRLGTNVVPTPIQ